MKIVRKWGEKCEKPFAERRLVLEDPESTARPKPKITFVNGSRAELRKVKVDGCAITRGPRCDYLVIAPNGVEHFVELKGTDVRHAVKQLAASIEQLSASPKRIEKLCFIVATKISPATLPYVQDSRIRFRKDWKSKLLVKERQAEYRIGT